MLAGGEGEGTWLLPDVLVNVLRGGDDGPGVVREVLGVCVPYDFGLLNPVVILSRACLHAFEPTGWILPSSTRVIE